MQRPFLRRIVFPSPIPAKSPAQRRETRLPARLFPKPPRSPVFPVFAHAPGSAFPAQIPRPHSVRMPAPLLRADSAFVSRPRFRVPVQVPHPDSAPASRRTFSLPAQRPHSATSLKRRPSENIPHSDAPPGATAPFPGLPAPRPFARFLKRKSPLERGPFSCTRISFPTCPSRSGAVR